MTKIFSVLVVILALAVTAALIAAEQTREQKLQQAIDLIESKGDLAGAMPLLEDVAKDSNRALAARALFYLGQAQERLSQPDARDIYERIVREFAGQMAIAAQAKERLAVMGGSPRAAGMAQRTILSGAAAARPWHSASPDGRHLSFQDSETGNLGTWDVRTRTTYLVTRSTGWQEGAVQSSSWSPDSSQLAYSWLDADYAISLRVIAAGGGPTRILYESAEVEWLKSFGWSADGRSILVELARKDGAHQLALVSVGDRSIRTIKEFVGQLGPTHVAFSPDGRRIVYAIPRSFVDPQRSLFIMASDGTDHRELVGGGGDNYLLGWLPDGRHVLFASDRRGTLGAWAIAVAQTSPQQQPIPIKDDIGPEVAGLGFVRDGRFYYSSSLNGADVYTVALDPTTGKAIEPPRPLPRVIAGVTRAQGAWSPDSTRIAYAQAFPGHGAILAVQTVGTGATRLYPLPVRGIERPFWQLDGRAVVIEAVDAERRQGLFRVDLESEAVETLVQSPGFTSAFASFSPDGALIYARYNRAESTIRRRSSLAAVEDVLWPDDRGTGANVLSPDGRLIAFWRGNSTTASISVGPTSGEERRTLVSDLHNSDNEIAWSHDGKYVLFAKVVRVKETDPWSGEVWRVSVDGGAAEPLGIHTGLIKHLSVRPDGREVAISVIGGGSRELLAWENIPGLVKDMSSR